MAMLRREHRTAELIRQRFGDREFSTDEYLDATQDVIEFEPCPLATLECWGVISCVSKSDSQGDTVWRLNG